MVVDALQDHVIICGFGHLGQLLASQLVASQHPFVVVTAETAAAEIAQELNYPFCRGDATSEAVLQVAGIAQAKVLATVLPDDASNLFITLTAKSLNPNLIVLARGDFAEIESKLKLAGADHVIMPAAISALRLVNLITRPSTLNFLAQRDQQSHVIELLSQLHMQVEEVVIAPTSTLLGVSLADLEVKAKGSFIVIALHRTDGRLLTQPDPALTLSRGDTVIVVGHAEQIHLFSQQYASKERLRYRGKQV